MRVSVIALLLGAFSSGEACSSGPAPLARGPRAAAMSGADTPATTAPVGASGGAAVVVGREPVTHAGSAKSEAGPSSSGGGAPAAEPLVVLEVPYSAQGHPRLATEMLTLERDEELFQWALGGSADPAHVSHQASYHPATRVVVDVELQSRAPKGTTNKLVRIARRSGYWPLRACFEAAERVAPRRERSATVRLTLGASGKVLGSRSLNGSGERDYARCVLERVRELDFRPGFTRKLDVDISVKQWPGHAPVPPRAPDPALPLNLPATTGAAFEAARPALTACYAQALKSDAGLWGRIAFRLTVDAAGRIQEATPVETRFPRAEVVECARQSLVGLDLRAPGVPELCFAFRLGPGPQPAPDSGQPPAPPPPEAGAPPSPVLPLPPVEPMH